MNKNIIKIVIFGILCLLLMGFKCETRYVEVPVLGTADQTIQIDEAGTAFSETGMVDATEVVNDIIESSAYEEVLGIHLQGITYTIIDNESNPGTTITGTVQVSATGAPGTEQDLMTLSGVNLASVEGTEQSPSLDSDGVLQIDQSISPFFHGDNRIYFHVTGNASSSPIKFKIKIKVAVVVLGKVEVDVPMM
jgi:hypothetical protein